MAAIFFNAFPQNGSIQYLRIPALFPQMNHMMYKFSVSLFLAFLHFQISAQVGKQFPAVEVEDLKGGTFQLPTHFDSEFTLIGIGTSKKAEDDLKTWQTPVYNKFVAKTGLMDQMYDVDICFLPIFTGASQAAKGQVVKKLKENNESLVLDHVMIYAGSREPFEKLGADDKDAPAFVLINKQGKVVWTKRGQFRQKYLDEIEEIISQ